MDMRKHEQTCQLYLQDCERVIIIFKSINLVQGFKSTVCSSTVEYQHALELYTFTYMLARIL